MVTSGARPSALRAFTATLDRIEFDTLSARSAPLRAALDDFRATAGWSDWLSDVPPLDIDYGATRGRLAQIADFVDQVAWAFESCDSDPNSDTQVYVDDSVLDALVTVDLDEPVTLVQDGERWIFPAPTMPTSSGWSPRTATPTSRSACSPSGPALSLIHI